jgi:hypothetical protein
MHSWKITAIDSTDARREGTALSLSQAWAEAFDAVMEQLTIGALDRCAIVVNGGPPALLIAGRTDEGHVDLPDTRAAVAGIAVAASGWPLPSSRITS